MGRIGNSWKLMKTSFSVLRKDKEILLFPVLSLIVTIVLLISIFTSFFFFIGVDMLFQPWTWVILFVIYVILYFIVLFFNTAVIGCATIRLNGGDPTIRDGFHIASKRIGKIFQWAVISAIVGVILKGLQQKGGTAGKIVSWIAGFAWTYATFFIIPVLIYEDKGVLRSIKRSAQIFKITWGETFIGSFGFGIIFFLFGLIGIVFIVTGAMFGAAGLLVGFIVAIIYWLIIGIVASATNGIYVAALYQFATKNQLPSAFDPSTIPKSINPTGVI